jgi:hypothetical protein
VELNGAARPSTVVVVWEALTAALGLSLPPGGEVSQRQQTHDYTCRYWGHDFAIMRLSDGGRRISLVGWGYGIANGDYLILPSGAETTRYQVEGVRYQGDPQDMWFADAVFAPRPAAVAP